MMTDTLSERLTQAVMAIVVGAFNRGILQHPDYRHLVEADVRSVIEALLTDANQGKH